MPADAQKIVRTLDAYYDRTLPRGIGLFEPGVPDDAPNAELFTQRLNRLIFVRIVRPNNGARLDLPAALPVHGRLGLHGELVAFGTWMLIDGTPGSPKRRGKAPDRRRLLKVTAAALAALIKSPALKRLRTREIVKFWKECFDEVTEPSDHASSLRSLRRILPEYLAHIKAGKLQFNGRRVRTSPQMSLLAEALKSSTPAAAAKATTLAGIGHSSSASAPAMRKPAPSVALTNFEIQLGYASPIEETEYRGTLAPTVSVPHLNYLIAPIEATSAEHMVRADRANRVVFKPEYDLASMASIVALIDRVAIVVDTKHPTSDQALQRGIAASMATAVYVADRTKDAGKSKWCASLPELDLSKPTGQHFAVMVQEPTPATLRTIMGTIEAIAGIDGQVRPFLLELAIDFYPTDQTDPVEALLTREKIVGLVQRHLWSAGSSLLDHEHHRPREADPRQVYSKDGKTATRFLFADSSGSRLSDMQLDEVSIRERLMTRRPGNDLNLNATIYRGDEAGPRRTNIQHKVADRRNPTKKTMTSLDARERRARIEVTLSSLEELEQAGLSTINELATCRFRSMRRNLLTFRLPTSGTDSGAIEDAIGQMKTRGVYGVEMAQRAAASEERSLLKPTPRNTDRDGRALVAWPEMNDLVGAALDRLHKTWRRF